MIYLFCRPAWEGGQYEGDDKGRFDALHLAMELGADYVDVELQVAFFSSQMGFASPYIP